MVMDKIWWGIGGGGGGSVVAGCSLYSMPLLRLDEARAINAMIWGWKAGAVIDGNIKSFLAVVTGVKDPGEMSDFESGGINWNLSFGASAKDAKNASKKYDEKASLLKLAKNLLVDGTREVAKTVAQSTKDNFEEFVKSTLTDDFTKQRLFLIDILAPEWGGGIWYEKQSVFVNNFDTLWGYANPQWNVRWTSAGVRLYARGLPIANGKHVKFKLMNKVDYAEDSHILFDKKVPQAKPKGFSGTNDGAQFGYVKNMELYEDAACTKKGYNLSDIALKGTKIYEWHSTSPTRQSGQFWGDTLTVGLKFYREHTANSAGFHSNEYITLNVSPDNGAALSVVNESANWKT
ncbi:MAG: hypothetical protein AAF408_06665 [Pseudomonadota bacterium]